MQVLERHGSGVQPRGPRTNRGASQVGCATNGICSAVLRRPPRAAHAAPTGAAAAPVPRLHRMPHRRVVMRAASVAEAPSLKLSDIQHRPLINLEGVVDPEVPPGVQAFVFALFDAHSKLQYVGFSKDLRTSLRTVLTRRPDKAYTYKMAPFPEVDQAGMVALRDAWFAEAGGPPVGNKLALERNMWQNPVDAGAISQRGKRGAADEKLRELLALLKARGFKEELVADEALMQDGQVDFLPAAAQSEEARAAAAAVRAASQRATRTATAIVDGQARQFTVHYTLRQKTNGGYMLDAQMMYDHQESRHRIVVGRNHYEPYELTPEAVAEAALGLLLANKLPRNSEGLLTMSQFPVNYFAITEVAQAFGDEWSEALAAAVGREVEQLNDNAAWRWTRSWPSMHTIPTAANPDAPRLTSSV